MAQGHGNQDDEGDSDEPDEGTPNRRTIRKAYHMERARRQKLEVEVDILRGLHAERQFRAVEDLATRRRSGV